MTGSVDKNGTLCQVLFERIHFWSNCKEIVTFPSRMDRPTIQRSDFWKKWLADSLGEINFFCAGLKKSPPKQLTHQKFLKVNFSNSKQIKSTRSQQVGTKRQSEIWNTIVPNKTKFSALDCCHQKQFCLKYYYRPDQASNLYALLVNFETREKNWIFLRDLIL